jgi:hypothetical protein
VKSKIISIIIFSVLIFLMFSFISLISIPWLFGSQHQAVAFLGILLMTFTIPIILYILLKKNIRPYIVFFYLLYFIFTSIITFLLSTILQDIIFWNLYSFDWKRLPEFFSLNYIFLYSLFFTFQLPIIIICFIIKNIYNYKEKINLKYFLKNPLLYILILILPIFPLILFPF